MDKNRRSALRVAIVILGLYSAAVIVSTVVQKGHPEWFVKFGEDVEVGHTTVFGRQILGPDIVTPLDTSQDGATFWMLSRDPLLLDVSDLKTYGDYPTYRAQRVLYPLLASPWRLLGEQGLLWGLVLTNLAIVFAGTYFTARLSQHLGGPAQAGYAFALSPAVLLSFVMDLADALAALCVVGVLLLIRRERWGWAIAVAFAAVLAKEQTLLVLLAIAIFAKAPWRQRVALVVGPAAAVAAWYVYIRTRFGWGNENPEPFVVVPFRSFVDTYRHGWSATGRYDEMVVALMVVAVGVWIVVRFWKRRTIELAACLPFAVLIPFYGDAVIYRPINSSRSLGPAVALLVVYVYAQKAAERRTTRAGVT